MPTAGDTDRKCHLRNAAEEHLEQGEEEEAGVELTIGNAVRVDMCAQEECGCNESNNASLYKHRHVFSTQNRICEESWLCLLPLELGRSLSLIYLNYTLLSG